MQGELPAPRNSHSCTAVGDKLFVFGGEDETDQPLNDLHVLDTSTNTWMTPDVRGEGPDARESHSAAAIGKLLFIFGGVGNSCETPVVKSYADLYILNTETMIWKQVEMKGSRPCKRTGESCISWKNKVIVIGGEDTKHYFMSGVWMLDTDTLTWTKLVTNGKPLPRRAEHTTVALGKNLFVLGGYIDDMPYDDLYMFDLETFKWTEVKPKGKRPIGRFSMTGSTTHPQRGGVLAFMGGCNKQIKPTDDMFYLHTGIVIENEGDHASSYDIQVSDELNANHNANGKTPFQAEVTESITNCKTIETVIDGKPLREVLSLNKAADDLRKRVAVDSGKKGFELAMTDATKSPEHQTPGAISVASDMKTPTVSNASPSLEVSEYNKMNASTAAEDTANSFYNHDGQSQPLATEEHGLPSSPIHSKYDSI